jgi:hypothetical protein
VNAHWRGLHFDFWFLHWFTKDGPHLWGAGLLVLLAAGLVWSGAGLRRFLVRPRAA